MNTLPQETYDAIGKLLHGPEFDLPALATVSRRWQSAIERRTFRDIHVRSDDLARFEELVQDDRRRYVRGIKYTIVLPGYIDEDRRRFERDNDRQANDEAFTDAIHRLFHLLQSWDLNKCSLLDLVIKDVYSQSDFPYVRHSSPKKDIRLYNRVRDDKTTIIDLLNWRHHYSCLRLLPLSELPLVPVISGFRLFHTTRNICGRVPLEIATRSPNLTCAYLDLDDRAISYITLRRTRRRDLARAVAELLPQSLRLHRLVLTLPSGHDWGPNSANGTLHPEAPHRDTLSDAIRTATAHMPALRFLSIHGLTDWSLLWPGRPPALVEPYWQNVERLDIDFHPRRPSGGHYFVDAEHPIQLGDAPSEEVPPGYRNNEEEEAAAMAIASFLEMHRPKFVDDVVPDDGSLVPLIKAFGQACIQMPNLKIAHITARVPAPIELDTGQRTCGYFSWGIHYFSPHMTYLYTGYRLDPALFENEHQRRLFWDVRDWRPDADLRGLLRGIGREEHGEHLDERFINSWETFEKDIWVQQMKELNSPREPET
ncbi:hypothetical protein GGR51DRAFT_535687 [Nemania sp. FL0031]|nr:hypothetical protein GGR51DRAFT_535687 [Nemania sp. FL0031]